MFNGLIILIILFISLCSFNYKLFLSFLRLNFLCRLAMSPIEIIRGNLILVVHTSRYVVRLLWASSISFVRFAAARFVLFSMSVFS